MPNIYIQINHIFYICLFLTFILTILFLYIILKKFIYKKKPLCKNEIILRKLKNLSFETKSTKELLYEFTILTKELKNNQIDQKLNSLLKKIEPFKYKKEDIVLNQELKKLLKEYINEL